MDPKFYNGPQDEGWSSWKFLSMGRSPQWCSSRVHSRTLPLLLLLFVNDLPDWIKSEMKMFADDTKLWCKIGQVSDSIPLQNDLRQVEHWTEKWQLTLNPDKCKVMHIGHRHTTGYVLQHNGNGKPRVLDESNEEKDLGVCVSTDLKPSTQCTKSANRAMSVYGLHIWLRTLRLLKRFSEEQQSVL